MEMHIIDFTIRNFKSYKDEANFTFEALNDDFKPNNVFKVKLEDGGYIRLLKSAALYGANAAGKSNVIWAMKCLAFFVTNSRNFPVGYKIPFEPFKLDGNTDDTSFSLRFIIRNRIYKYSISYNENGFTDEVLSFFENNIEKKVFFKQLNKFSIGDGWESSNLDISHFDDTRFSLLSHHLLLSELAIKPQNQLQDIYSAISEIIAEPVLNNFNLRAKNIEASRDILKNQESVMFKQLGKLMSIADLGIVGLEMNRHGDEEFQFPDSIPTEIREQFIEENRWEFKTLHKTKTSQIISFPLEIESTGTQNMFSLGSTVLKVLSEGGFLAYDEMDIAVHPQLFKLLISLFHSPISNPHNAQILFTTHNTIIVNETEGILRADQIWFAEKNPYGESSLFSAQDFDNISITVPFERWYRQGRFGAMPNIGNFTEIFNQS